MSNAIIVARKRHVKKECWSNQKSRDGKAVMSLNAQGCVTSTLNDSEVLYSETTTNAEGRKGQSDLFFIDSRATWHMTFQK